MAQSISTRSSSSLLKQALLADALITTGGALAFIAIGVSPLANIMGFTNSVLPIDLGIGLLVYVAWLFWITRKPVVNPRAAMGAVVINDLWVVGSLFVLLSNQSPLTIFGKVFVAVIALVVATFAILQFYAIRQQTRA